MNKKWVELFEKVIGRKPTPEEFIAGRDSGFDFKAIKSIAGVAIDQVAHVHKGRRNALPRPVGVDLQALLLVPALLVLGRAFLRPLWTCATSRRDRIST